MVERDNKLETAEAFYQVLKSAAIKYMRNGVF